MLKQHHEVYLEPRKVQGRGPMLKAQQPLLVMKRKDRNAHANAGYQMPLRSCPIAKSKFLDHISPVLASKEIDVMIVKCGTGEHHTMWVEGCRCNGIRSIVLEEIRRRYNAVEESTVYIEEVDIVLVRAPGYRSVLFSQTSCSAGLT